MGDAGEGLIDQDSRIQERMEELERERATRRAKDTRDPEQVRALESLRLARRELEAQLAAGRAPAAASPSNDGLTEPAGTSGNTTDEHGEPEGSNSLSGRTIQD